MSIQKHPLRVYSDTTVFGGISDPEFEVVSGQFFDLVIAGKIILVMSSLVELEVSRGPQQVRELLIDVMADAEVVEINEQALNLQKAYIDAGFVRAKSHNDALHVALATIHRCGLIVSWNFRDIVNYRKIPLYNATNKMQGYESISIYSPLEVIKNEDEDI